MGPIEIPEKQFRFAGKLISYSFRFNGLKFNVFIFILLAVIVNKYNL